MEFNKTKLYRKQFTSSTLQVTVPAWEAQCVIQAFIVLFSECNLKPPSGGSQAECRDEVTPSCDITGSHGNCAPAAGSNFPISKLE